MMPVSTSEGIPVLFPADNCSVADTSIEDRTLTSFIENAASVTPLGPPEKLLDHETSPFTKHKGISTEMVAVENWRPNISTIKEKSTDSAGSAMDQTLNATGLGGKCVAKTSVSDIGSFRRRRPGATYGPDVLASMKAQLAERSGSEVSNTSFTIPLDSDHSSLMLPLGPEPESQTTSKFSFPNLSRLPLFSTSGCERNEDSKWAPTSDNKDCLQDFSFATQSRLPLYVTPQGPKCTPDSKDPPEILSLSPTLQSLVRANLRPDAGEKGRAVAAIILECFSGPKDKSGTFEFLSRARLPPYASLRPETLKQRVCVKIENFVYSKDSGSGFFFPQNARLPLHAIAGAEDKRPKVSVKQSDNDLAYSKYRGGRFEFKNWPSLPSFSSFFKTPIETSSLSTQLARKGFPVQISEARKKGHIVGSIDSIGEYIRPNADNSFLFSITPLTRTELLEKRKGNDVLFGKLEKARWKQEHAQEQPKPTRLTYGKGDIDLRACSLHGERSSASTDCSTQTAPSSKPSEGGNYAPAPAPVIPVGVGAPEDEKSTEDRNRFDALVNRLQQKLSERSEKDRRSTSSGMGRTPSNPSDAGTRPQSVSQARQAGQLLGYGSHMNYGTMSNQRSSQQEQQMTWLTASTAGSVDSRSRKTSSDSKTDEPDSNTKTPSLATTDSKEGYQTSKDNPKLPIPESKFDGLPMVSSQCQSQPSTLACRPTAPSLAPPKLNPRPTVAPPSEGVCIGTAGSGQTPFNTLVSPVPCSSFSEQHATVSGMLPPPGVWQPLPPQAPTALGAPLPVLPLPCPGFAEPQWPVSKRTNRRGRTPFIPLNAAEQQKIEEHIELLKSTIPNFATVSKRRQELRWGKHREKFDRQQTRGSWQQINPYMPQPVYWQPQPQQHLQQQMLQQQQVQSVQQLQRMQQMQQEQQYYQQGLPALAPQPMQPYYPYAQQYPTPLGTSRWQ